MTNPNDMIRRAVARGWCHAVNSGKEMDPELADAITQEVSALPAASDTPEVLALVEALRMMIDQEVDYMTRNSLGDPEKQHSVKVSRAAIAAWEAKCA